MDSAILAYSRGVGLREAAREFDVDPSTSAYRAKGWHGKKRGHQHSLNNTEESVQFWSNCYTIVLQSESCIEESIAEVGLSDVTSI